MKINLNDGYAAPTAERSTWRLGVPFLLMTLATSVSLWGVLAAPQPAESVIPTYSWTIPTLPCVYEDASAVRDRTYGCYWDSGERGNGDGLSYWVSPDSQGHKFHYLDPSHGR